MLVIALAFAGMTEKRILLLEDEALVAEYLTLVLSDEGYVVDHAATVAEGRSRLDERQYSLVIADLRLPDGNGLVVAERGAELGAKTCILSGYLSQLPQGSTQRHELWMKPIRPSEVVWAVQRSIGAPDSQPSRLPSSANSSAVKVIEIIEFDHFVSFHIQIADMQSVVQYRRAQVWLNDQNNWEISEDQQPFNVYTKLGKADCPTTNFCCSAKST